MILVKLGGSLITDKRRDACARHAVIERLAKEIAEARGAMSERLILGHGSGSFGHVAAARHGLGRGPVGPEVGAGVAETQHQAATLHHLVIDALVSAGVAAYSWAPSSTLAARAGKPVSASLEPLLLALAAGRVPVTYGDVVQDRDWGASICSTEAVLGYLIGRLRRRGSRIGRLLWLGETDGVYDRRGDTIPRVDAGSFRQVLKSVEAPAGTDVTGGMLLRLRTARALARLGIESWILNGKTPGLLADLLRGNDVEEHRSAATRFVAEGS